MKEILNWRYYAIILLFLTGAISLAKAEYACYVGEEYLLIKYIVGLPLSCVCFIYGKKLLVKFMNQHSVPFLEKLDRIISDDFMEQ